MSEIPKRENFQSDDKFLEAMANYHQVPMYMLKQPSAENIALCEKVWEKVRARHDKEVQS